jgi:hypothetical protein
VYRDESGRFYVQTGRGLAVDNIIHIQGYTDGQLGMQLTGPGLVVDPATTRLIEGDLKPKDFYPDWAGVQVGHDELGNILTENNVSETNRSDELYDSSFNDHIKASGGDDAVAYRNLLIQSCEVGEIVTFRNNASKTRFVIFPINHFFDSVIARAA